MVICLHLKGFFFVASNGPSLQQAQVSIARYWQGHIKEVISFGMSVNITDAPL